MVLVWKMHILSGHYVDGLMQKRHNSIANAFELRLFCINSLRPSDASVRQ